MKRFFIISLLLPLIFVGCGKKTEEEVGVELKGIGLNKKSLSLDIGETARLMVVYNPEEAEKFAPEVTWESTVPGVATVQDGKVTAKQKGKTIISAYCGKFYADCEVVVETGGGSGGEGGGGEDPQKFEVTPATIDDNGLGGTYTITVTSNRAWTAVCEKAWATVSPAEGNGDATVTVTVEANTEVAADAQTITFTAGLMKKTVTVNRAGYQKICPITLNITEKEMPVEGGSFYVQVESETAWNVTCEKDWVTFSGKTDEGVTVNVGPNVSELNWRPDEWMKIPVVFSNGTKSDTLEIRQDIPYVKISPDKFYTFDALKFETKVTSNISWRLEFSYDDKVSGAEGVKNYMHAQPATGTGNETIQVTISKVHSDDKPHNGHGSVWAYGTGTWSGLSVSVGSHGYYSSDFKE
ncbi:MAG: Ig-like domain-containing protein [Paludibacteraceae bacterium]|nr:Ig-like domain-containing protein [Paludibacteraceae bacterium]